MASDIDLCNTALSHIGAASNVSSIDPPDGSAYAVFCRRYFPIARDEALEAHNWNFAVKRAALSQPTDVAAPDSWAYVYNLPADVLRPIAVLPYGYTDDNSQIANYDIEGDYLYSNEADATLRYISRADTGKWTPSFFVCASWKLAQHLSGAIFKGDAQMRSYCAKEYERTLAKAAAINANSSRNHPEHIPVWISDR
jgi:hypothetical protein